MLNEPALHPYTNDELSQLPEKTTLASADLLLIEDSAASGAKKKVQAANVTSAGSVFGRDYQVVVSEGNSNTTSATWQDKVTLTTGALTGTYRVDFYCEVNAATNNKNSQVRLYNVTDATELCWDENKSVANALYRAISGFCDSLVFTGAAKTFKVQYNSPDGATTVNIRRTRLEIWRVS